MKQINFQGTVNPTSLGNVSYNFLRELYRLKDQYSVSIFPYGNQMIFSNFDHAEPEFIEWCREGFLGRLRNYSSEAPAFKNWHLNGSELTVGNGGFLYTYYETDEPTEDELNLVANQKHVFFSSQEAADHFKIKGLTNVSAVPLGFDEDILKGHSVPNGTDVIHFGLIGKLEKRKNTIQIIKNWLSKYGNNPKYQLHCLINNPFFKPEDFDKILTATFNNQRWTNVNVLPFLEKNSEVSQLMRFIDIDLSGLSSAEGWNLPSFNSTALGKWSVVTNCSSHKDWATNDNCILVEPNGKYPCYDGVFFQTGTPFSQGSFYQISDAAMIDGMERAVAKAKTTNKSGLELQKTFSYANSVSSILRVINA